MEFIEFNMVLDVIGSKFHLLSKLFNLMDELMLKNEEDLKKNGLFY